jgi:cobalt/nickel transport system permease protein
MHMADALVSPAIGGTMWAVSAGLISYSSTKVARLASDRTVPLMGVLGAFVFAVQMINFAIPGTGSSGHLGGGMLLAILLGPWAALLTLASILAIQALFFADGGILALGCNIFNMGVFPCLLAYPFLYKPIAGAWPQKPRRILAAAIIAGVVGLQLGSFSVVLETTLSGITDLPITTFALFMQPIHLAIGVIEGLATASIVLFLRRNRPELLSESAFPTSGGGIGAKALAVVILAAVVTAGLLSWLASTRPDGLEWSIARTAGKEEMAPAESPLHRALARLQSKSSVLADYGFRKAQAPATGKEVSASPSLRDKTETSIAGLVGGTLTLAVATLLGLLLRRRRRNLVEPRA